MNKKQMVDKYGLETTLLLLNSKLIDDMDVVVYEDGRIEYPETEIQKVFDILKPQGLNTKESTR